MRINKDDMILGKCLNRKGEILAPSIKDTGFSLIASVISEIKTRIPSGTKGPFVFEIYNIDKQQVGRYNNSGSKVS